MIFYLCIEIERFSELLCVVCAAAVDALHGQIVIKVRFMCIWWDAVRSLMFTHADQHRAAYSLPKPPFRRTLNIQSAPLTAGLRFYMFYLLVSFAPPFICSRKPALTLASETNHNTWACTKQYSLAYTFIMWPFQQRVNTVRPEREREWKIVINSPNFEYFVPCQLLASLLMEVGDFYEHLNDDWFYNALNVQQPKERTIFC